METNLTLIAFLAACNVAQFIFVVVIFFRNRPKPLYSLKVNRRVGFFFKRDWLLVTKQEFIRGVPVGQPTPLVEMSAKVIDESRIQQVLKTVEGAAKFSLVDVARKFLIG